MAMPVSARHGCVRLARGACVSSSPVLPSAVSTLRNHARYLHYGGALASDLAAYADRHPDALPRRVMPRTGWKIPTLAFGPDLQGAKGGQEKDRDAGITLSAHKQEMHSAVLDAHVNMLWLDGDGIVRRRDAVVQERMGDRRGLAGWEGDKLADVLCTGAVRRSDMVIVLEFSVSAEGAPAASAASSSQGSIESNSNSSDSSLPSRVSAALQSLDLQMADIISIRIPSDPSRFDTRTELPLLFEQCERMVAQGLTQYYSLACDAFTPVEQPVTQTAVPAASSSPAGASSTPAGKAAAQPLAPIFESAESVTGLAHKWRKQYQMKANAAAEQAARDLRSARASVAKGSDANGNNCSCGESTRAGAALGASQPSLLLHAVSRRAAAEIAYHDTETEATGNIIGRHGERGDLGAAKRALAYLPPPAADKHHLVALSYHADILTLEPLWPLLVDANGKEWSPAQMIREHLGLAQFIRSPLDVRVKGPIPSEAARIQREAAAAASGSAGLNGQGPAPVPERERLFKCSSVALDSAPLGRHGPRTMTELAPLLNGAANAAIALEQAWEKTVKGQIKTLQEQEGISGTRADSPTSSPTGVSGGVGAGSAVSNTGGVYISSGGTAAVASLQPRDTSWARIVAGNIDDLLHGSSLAEWKAMRHNLIRPAVDSVISIARDYPPTLAWANQYREAMKNLLSIVERALYLQHVNRTAKIGQEIESVLRELTGEKLGTNKLEAKVLSLLCSPAIPVDGVILDSASVAVSGGFNRPQAQAQAQGEAQQKRPGLGGAGREGGNADQETAAGAADVAGNGSNKTPKLPPLLAAWRASLPLERVLELRQAQRGIKAAMVDPAIEPPAMQ